MLGSNLAKALKIAKKNWEVMKSDLGENSRSVEFLSHSYLVLANAHVQVELREFENGLNRVAFEKPALLKRAEVNMGFISLCRMLRELEWKYRISQLKGYRHKQLKAVIVRLRQKLDGFDMYSLDFADDLNVEVRFPTVNMNLIQRLKQHPLADSSRTSMSMSSIRVVIDSE